MKMHGLHTAVSRLDFRNRPEADIETAVKSATDNETLVRTERMLALQHRTMLNGIYSQAGSFMLWFLLAPTTIGLVLVALMSGDRWMALGVALLIPTFGVLGAAVVEFALHNFTSEDFWSSASHKGRAMRGFLPTSLGVICSLLATGGVLGLAKSFWAPGDANN